MEVEAKFQVPDGGRLGRLAAVPRLAGYDLEASSARRDDDTFFDTPDRRFLAAGYYFRRRENADGLRYTLKQLASSADGVLRREEIEQRAATDVPVRQWPRGPLRTRVLELAGDSDVAPLFSLVQERRTRRVRRSGAVVGELSLDAVAMTAGGRDERWFEAEVELADGGTDDDLAQLSAALREVWDLAPEPSSKFARALALLERTDGHVPSEPLPATDAGAAEVAAGASVAAAAEVDPVTGAAVTATEGAASPSTEATDSWRPSADEAARKRPGISRDDTMAEAALATLRLHFAKMCAHQEGTRLGEDAEELHDMRVATRRMRMALRLFGPYLDPAVVQPVFKGLRRTGRTLGAVRDLDVFAAKTAAYVEGSPHERGAELDPLMEAWRHEYDARRRVLVEYLDGRKYARFVDRLAGLLAGPAGALAAPGSGAVVAHVLPALLHRDLADVLAAGSAASTPGAPLTRFHELRIAGKALRYTLEFFEEPLGEDAARLIEATKRLQDHLGDLQDAVVSCGILRDVLTWGSWAPESAELPTHTTIVRAPGVARYLAWRQDEMQRLVITFPEVWPSVAGEEFGARLAGLLARL